MTISRRGGKRFAGIVAVGDNRSAACDAYRAAVNERSLTLCSESNVFTAIAGDSDGEFSPFTGNAMNIASDEMHGALHSESASDIDTINVHVSVCSDGCNKVLVSDSGLEPDFCPSCSSAIPELEDSQILDELQQLESESDDDNFDGDGVMNVNGDQGIVVVANSLEEAQAVFVETINDESERVTMTDGSASYVTHASCIEDFSPFSGEASEEDDDEEVDLESFSSVDEDEEIEANYLQCVSSGCEAHILSTSEHTSFCPKCSGGLIDPEILSALSSSDDDELDDLDDLEIDDEDLESESGDLDADDLDDLEDDLDALDEDDFDLESDSGEDFDDEDEDDELDDDLDELEDDFESDSATFESFSSDDDDEDDDDLEDDLDDIDDDEDDDEDDEDDDDLESDSAVGEMEINFFEAYAGVDEDEHDPDCVHVAHCGSIQGDNTWMAMYNGYPVARCLESQSSNPIFNSAKFGEAVAATIRSQGVRAGLVDMGFEFLKPDVDFNVSVSSKLVQEHQQELQDMRESVSTEVEEVQDRFQMALSTSAMALNRNVLKGRRNPLVDSLVSSMRAAGLGNADTLVATAFEQHSDSYVKNLVELASEQVSKPLETQNNFADMVAQASFQGTASTVSTGVDIGRSLSSTSSVEQNKTVETQLSSTSSDSSDYKTRAASALDSL